MRKKVCILTQSHLCRNPRVVKEAILLATTGFEVVILTTFTFPELLMEDLRLIENKGVTLKGVVNMIPSQISAWYRLKERLTRRIAGEAISRFGLENIHALGYDYHKNLRAALQEKADIYTCHQEVSMVIGCKLVEKGCKVAFDLEDWYSHDLLPSANRSRPVKLLEKYEKYALREGVLIYTTSSAMAVALGSFANTLPPHVIQNVFPFSDRQDIDGQIKDRVDISMPSLHWYSQTIGPGRGIEFLVETLIDVETPVELHLRGNLYPEFRQELINRFPSGKGHKLFFHSLVPHSELLSRIAEHDIGLATEEYFPESRNLTITNKILQYLLGGVAVVASDTMGQKEVEKEAHGAVFLFGNGDRNGLAMTLNGLLSNRDELAAARRAAVNAAKNTFCWEQQGPRLINWITEAIQIIPK